MLILKVDINILLVVCVEAKIKQKFVLQMEAKTRDFSLCEDLSGTSKCSSEVFVFRALNKYKNLTEPLSPKTKNNETKTLSMSCQHPHI